MSKGASGYRTYHLIGISCICLLGALIYSNTLSVPFVFDDIDNIRANPHVRVTSLDLQSLYDAGFKSRLPRRPLANVSFALNYYFGRYDVTGEPPSPLVFHSRATGSP